MTKDDMVKVARECGIGLAYGRESIERFYTFVAAAERAECARLVERGMGDWKLGMKVAAAIRARDEA